MGSRLTPPAGTLRYEDLPGLPRLFVDCARRLPEALPYCSCPPLPESLAAHARSRRSEPLDRRAIAAVLDRDGARFGAGPEARANIRRLEATDAVIVDAAVAPAPLGGPLGVVLAAVSAIAAARRLEADGFAAVPLVWIGSAPAESSALLWPDDEGGTAAGSAEEALRRSGAWDPGTADLLRDCYAPGNSPADALGRLLAALTARWGVVIADATAPEWSDLGRVRLARRLESDPDSVEILRSQTERLREAGYLGEAETPAEEVFAALYREAALPTAAHVAGPAEFAAFARVLPLHAKLGLEPPLVLPRASATVVEARSRKTLEKYGCGLADLFAGPAPLVERLDAPDPQRAAGSRFEALADGLVERMNRLERALAAGGAAPAELEKEIESSRSRIQYQIDKLRQRYSAAETLRGEIMARQIGRACALLAPGGALQENGLPAAYLLLRYTPALVERLLDEVDIWKHEHQIVHPD
jgi:uncharacterized protein YllA (UPF0747 family)